MPQAYRFNKGHYLSVLPVVSDFYRYAVSDEIKLELVHQLRDLGILVSNDLSWSPHIATVAYKARQKASYALSVFHAISISIIFTLYKSMERSLVEYSCPPWHPTKIRDIQELISVQKTFTARIADMQDVYIGIA